MLGGPPGAQGSLPRDSRFLESRFQTLSLVSLLAGGRLGLVLGALGGAGVLERAVGPRGGLVLGPRTLEARGVLGGTGSAPWISYMNCSEQIYSSLCFRIMAIVCFSPGTNRRLHLPPHIK